LYVTGALGGAAAELAEMAARGSSRKGRAGREGHPQLYPEPRVAAGLGLVRRGLATAAIDLSDGLSTDLGHLCRESGCGAEVLEEALPVHPLAAKRGRGVELALNGGEDYELLFAARPGVRMPRTVGGVQVTRIGRLVRGTEVSLVDEAGGRRRLEAGGWEHFSKV